MKRLVQAHTEKLRVSGWQSRKNLTVYPLFSGRQACLACLTLDETFIRGLVEIGEVDAQGSVPELRLANHSELMLLILDGEELVGAKQNRDDIGTVVRRRHRQGAGALQKRPGPIDDVARDSG